MIRRPSRVDVSSAVRLGEQLLRQHDLEQRRAGGVEDSPEGPVGERDRVDQPRVAAVVDEQEHEHDRPEHAVGDDHQRPPAHPVGEQPAEWRQQRARGEGEERQAGERARPGQRLHPDREDDEHRPVAERRQRLPGEQEPGVAMRQERAHQLARNTFTSPLTVRPRRTTVGAASPSPYWGSLASGTSEREVARGRAGVDVDGRALGDTDLDVAGHAREADVARGHRLEADVAGDGLRLDRARDRPDAEVARDGLRGHVSLDAVEVGVAADRLDGGVAGDLAAHAEVAGDGVDAERTEVAVEPRVRRGGLHLDARAVRDGGPHAQLAAEDERERGEREAELALAVVRDDDAVAVLADLDLLEEALVAVDGDVRLLALGRLDLDVAGGNADFELEGQWSVEGLLEHLRGTRRVSRLTRSRISLSRGDWRRSGRIGGRGA